MFCASYTCRPCHPEPATTALLQAEIRAWQQGLSGLKEQVAAELAGLRGEMKAGGQAGSSDAGGA